METSPELPPNDLARLSLEELRVRSDQLSEQAKKLTEHAQRLVHEEERLANQMIALEDQLGAAWRDGEGREAEAMNRRAIDLFGQFHEKSVLISEVVSTLGQCYKLHDAVWDEIRKKERA